VGARAFAALEQAIALANEFIEASALGAEVLQIACEVDCPAYDAAYLAAAKQRGAMIVSLDRRLAASAKLVKVPIARL
jgi:predicted nucleic acid-binding protein